MFIVSSNNVPNLSKIGVGGMLIFHFFVRLSWNVPIKLFHVSVRSCLEFSPRVHAPFVYSAFLFPPYQM